MFLVLTRSPRRVDELSFLARRIPTVETSYIEEINKENKNKIKLSHVSLSVWYQLLFFLFLFYFILLLLFGDITHIASFGSVFAPKFFISFQFTLFSMNLAQFIY